MNPYMEMALKEARKGVAEGKGGPFGAVIVKAGKVLSAASNEVLCSHDPTAHAEIVAIRQACRKLQTYDLTGSVLYATGEPCPMCLSAIIWANIQRVYFASAAAEAEKIGFRDSGIYRHLRGEDKLLEVEQIDREEGIALYDEYRRTGKTIY
ncbi:MAG: nucleoside deaminase [Peptococcaceae bacterium]|nr:nucleoside deaminase [Peptococcaceae bacterium]